MQGLKVGHFTDELKGTGVSVFLFAKPAVGGYVLCGSGPATHELAPLDPDTSVASVHGLVFAGGSAFGLGAAAGVMRFLSEQGMGLPMPHGGVVPIVPAAAIYDLSYKEAAIPSPQDAYQACLNAKENSELSGRIGAGTGATVGKVIKSAKRMTSGLGRAELHVGDGITVLAYAVVNAIGDVRDQHNQIIAGARDENNQFADITQYLLSGQAENVFFPHDNTTLVAVFTNAKFSKAELRRISKMAIAGMARAISPIFSCYDGDILFAICLGDKQASVLTIGTIAAEVVRLAIVNAVKDAQII